MEKEVAGNKIVIITEKTIGPLVTPQDTGIGS